jgi:transcriptional regulator with XRE-family HTH domain
MPHVPSSEAIGLVLRAQEALGLTQERLGEMLGVSRRTVTRWIARDSCPSNGDLHALARAVHPTNAELAVMLAQEGGQTLESLGILTPAPPVEPKELPVPAPRPFPPTRLLVESIVCAAAESMNAPPVSVRDALRSAFARARGLGLTVEEVDDALSPAPQPRGKEPKTAAARSSPGARATTKRNGPLKK